MAAADVLLLTGGTDMPAPDPESGLLVAALADRGLRAELVVWDGGVDWSAAALVVSRTPWDYIDRPEAFVARLREIAAVTTLVNDAELIAWNVHKGYLDELAQAGVPVVPLSVVRRGAGVAAMDAARTAFGDEIVIKPAISAGAWKAIRTTAASSEAREHLAALIEAEDALVQPYLASVQDGEVSLIYLDGALSHAVRKVPAHGDFRVHAEYGGSIERHDPTDAEREVAAAVLRAAPAPTTYARIDLVEGADGPLLMEAELIDPELFLPYDDGAAARYAGVLVGLLA